MYRVVLILSLVIWAVVIAIIISTPTDVLRMVQRLNHTRGKEPRSFVVRPASQLQGGSFNGVNPHYPRSQRAVDPTPLPGPKVRANTRRRHYMHFACLRPRFQPLLSLQTSGELGYGQQEGAIFQRLDAVAAIGHDEQVPLVGVPRLVSR
jgi:hypothetical protein